jgi:EmrB/QacA subfamily drug resistance transporter
VTERAAASPDTTGDAPEKLDRRIYLLTLTVVAGVIMSVFDTTVVIVALDELSRQLHAPLSTVQWVVTAYLLALAVVIPLSGWATDRYGARTAWLVAVTGFTAGSVLSGLAWNIESLIAFRVVQGLAGGMMMPVGQALLVVSAGPRRMGRVMGILSVPMVLGPVLGPILGGLVVQEVGWRWIFFVNLPTGLVALALALTLLPATPPARKGKRLDVPGLVLLASGLVATLYGLSRAASAGGFTGSTTIACLAAGLALLAGFTVYSRARGDAAIIDVRLYTNKVFAAASANTLLLAAAMYGALLLLPLYFQSVRGNGALDTGLLLMPLGLGAATAMPIAGRLTDRLGPRRPMLIGLGCALLGTLAYTRIGPDTGYPLLAIALYVSGLGMGATMTPNMVATYISLPKADVPRASSAYGIQRQVGASFGAALYAVVLSRNVDRHLDGGSPDPARLAGAFNDTFWLAFVLTAAMIGTAMLLPMRAPAPARPSAAPEEPARA